MKDGKAMNREGILPCAAVETSSEPRGPGKARPPHPAPEGKESAPSAGTDRFVKSGTEPLFQEGDGSTDLQGRRGMPSQRQDGGGPEKTAPPRSAASCPGPPREIDAPPSSESSRRTEKRKAPLLLGMAAGHSTRKSEKGNADSTPRPPQLPDGFSIESFARLASTILLGVSILFLVAKALTVLSAPSWWRSGAEERRMIRLCEEGKELFAFVRALDQELAARTRLAPVVAAVAFSAVPSLLVDEMELVAPSPSQAGRIRIRIRSFDSDGMGALATFGAMVGLGFERSTGRKIRLNPTDLSIPYSLDGGESHSGEPIRALLSASLRWEDLR